MPSRFGAKKQSILSRLAQPEGEYQDLSPKGSVDEQIRELVSEINGSEGFVTTSSCSGRVAVYLDGPAKDGDDGHTNTGKGGGKWLFTSHSAINIDSCYTEDGALYDMLGFHPRRAPPTLEGTDERARYVHFKFEPMILHILTSSPENAQLCLTAALSSGFRESGISSLMDSKGQPTPPLVAVRSSGQATDTIIAFLSADDEYFVSLTTEDLLRRYISLSSLQFRENGLRQNRFRENFSKLVSARDQGPSATLSDVRMARHHKQSDKQRRKNERKAETQQALGKTPASDGAINIDN